MITKLEDMKMTKQVRERMELLQGSTDELRALRWSDAEEAALAPDVPRPGVDSTFGTVELGWSVNAARINGRNVSGAVYATWSRCTAHGSGDGDQGGSQDGRAQHSTRLRALRALRRKVERKAAARLAAIDRDIAEETGAPTARSAKGAR